jgi:hypothetical protein
LIAVGGPEQRAAAAAVVVEYIVDGIVGGTADEVGTVDGGGNPGREHVVRCWHHGGADEAFVETTWREKCCDRNGNK